MAGGQFSLAQLYGMTIRESANDGSDFTNPAADYRRLFLGEDGQLHVKDSAGTVTDIGGGSSGIPATLFDAKGDIIAASAADTAAKVTVGANGTALVADSTAGAGVAWGFPTIMGCKVYKSGTQSITDSIDAAALFDSEEYDTDTLHDTGSNTSRIVLKRVGRWLVIANTLWAASATGRRVMYFKKNGTGPIRGANINQQAPAAGQCQQSASTIVTATAITDYVELWVVPVGVTLNIIADTTFEAIYQGV